MLPTHKAFRLASLLLLMAAATACDIGSTLEPEPLEPAHQPPRTVKPKVLTTIPARVPLPR